MVPFSFCSHIRSHIQHPFELPCRCAAPCNVHKLFVRGSADALTRLANKGWLRAHQTSVEEIAHRLAIVMRVPEMSRVTTPFTLERCCAWGNFRKCRHLARQGFQVGLKLGRGHSVADRGKNGSHRQSALVRSARSPVPHWRRRRPGSAGVDRADTNARPR